VTLAIPSASVAATEIVVRLGAVTQYVAVADRGPRGRCSLCPFGFRVGEGGPGVAGAGVGAGVGVGRDGRCRGRRAWAHAGVGVGMGVGVGAGGAAQVATGASLVPQLERPALPSVSMPAPAMDLDSRRRPSA
jgi:hypothetical protein